MITNCSGGVPGRAKPRRMDGRWGDEVREVDERRKVVLKCAFGMRGLWMKRGLHRCFMIYYDTVGRLHRENLNK